MPSIEEEVELATTPPQVPDRLFESEQPDFESALASRGGTDRFGHTPEPLASCPERE